MINRYSLLTGIGLPCLFLLFFCSCVASAPIDKINETTAQIHDNLRNNQSQSQHKMIQGQARVQLDQLQSQIALLEKQKSFTQALVVSICVLTIISLSNGWAYYTHRQKVTQHIDLERLRVRIASDLHDELGSSLTRISMLSDLVCSGALPEAQPQQLQTISRISREAITTMSDVIWSIDARNETLGALLERMTDCTCTLLVEQGIVVNYQKAQWPLSKVLALDTRRDLYLIFKEAINNCAKHAKATAVDINLAYQNNRLSLYITDNGTGLNDQNKPTGQGLKNIHMRAKRLNAQLSIVSENGLSIELTDIELT